MKPLQGHAAVHSFYQLAQATLTGLFVNRLTSAVRDRLVDAPEYKVTAVRLERIA